MQQTFISAYGKVVIENGVLYVRNLKPALTFSQFAWVGFRVFVLLRFILFVLEEASPRRNVGLVFFSVLLLFYGSELAYAAYKAVFLQSFSKRIPLPDILSYRLEEDTNELERHLYLVEP